MLVQSMTSQVIEMASKLFIKVVFVVLTLFSQSSALPWEEEVTFTVLSSSTSNIVIRMDAPPDLDWNPRKYPYVGQSIIVPGSVTSSINVIDFDTVIVPHNVPNVLGSFKLSPVIQVAGPHILRDYYCNSLKVYLCESNPTHFKLYTHITFEVSFQSLKSSLPVGKLSTTGELANEFDDLYNARFLNYSDYRDPEVEPIPGDMLIICHDAFSAAMQPFVNWKRQKGIKTTLVNVSGIGNDSTLIKNYITNFYDTTNLTWVLLVGDKPQITSHMDKPFVNSGTGPADNKYTYLVGNDGYPEIMIGRFSAENLAHVQTQVERTITYERDHPGSNWFHKGLIAAICEPAGECFMERYEWFEELLLNSTYTQVDWVLDENLGPFGTAEVTSAVNDGRSILYYYGHGGPTVWSNPDFGVTNIDQLTNDNKLPFIMGAGCSNGHFHGITGPCLAEAWLRATNDITGKPTGAIGMYSPSMPIGGATIMAISDGVLPLLTSGRLTTSGTAIVNGSCRYLEWAGGGLSGEVSVMIFFGDPSVQLRTDNPQVLSSINYPHDIQCGQTSFTLDIGTASGALCAITANGVIYGKAYTDDNGVAVIVYSKPILPNVTYTLTVTGFNLATFVDANIAGFPDSDGDGIGNACDNCPNTNSQNQTDSDGDLVGDVCDLCPGFDDLQDSDLDGAPNACDNCPTVTNSNQANLDGDSFGDACDLCTDQDGDGFGNPGFPLNTCALDNCPTMSNPSQLSCCEVSLWPLYGPNSNSCGDNNCTGGIANALDLTKLVDYFFRSGTPPCPLVQAGDENCDGTTNVQDMTFLVDYIYRGSGIRPCHICKWYDTGVIYRCP